MSNHTRNPRRIRPSYPTRPELLAEPGRLAEHLPDSWQEMIAKGGLTVAFLISGLAGCSQSGPNPTAEPTTRTTGSATSSPTTRAGILTPVAAIVAPIFNHGEGIATTGCVVVTPPVFLTEEEARQVIRDELARAGLKMPLQHVVLKGIGGKSDSSVNGMAKDGKPHIPTLADEPYLLVVDLLDPDKHVAVKFVSAGKYEELGGELSHSIVKHYDFKKVGEALADEIKANGKGHFFGVFYDPASLMEHPLASTDRDAGPKTWTERREETKTASREELRQQVRDFAQWLRQRGVI